MDNKPEKEEKPQAEIIAEKRVFDDYFKVDEAIYKEVDEDGKESTYSRLKLNRPDAVAVMVYNSDLDTVVLVKQERYPIKEKVDSPIFEIPAGKIDGDEEPKKTAIREIKEEIGYEIEDDNLVAVSRFFASPGYSSEMIYLFAASVVESQRTTDGGGVESEHENIDIYNVPVGQFFDMVAGGGIIDAKSLMGAQALWHLRNSNVIEAGREYLEIQRLEKAKITAEKVINDESEDDAEETSK